MTNLIYIFRYVSLITGYILNTLFFGYLLAELAFSKVATNNILRISFDKKITLTQVNSLTFTLLVKPGETVTSRNYMQSLIACMF